MRAAGLILLLSIAGCATEDAPSPSSAAVTNLPLQELPPQALAAAQCALFLWTRTTPPQRVLMATDRPAVARLRIDGRSVDLPRTAYEGEPVAGHPPVQRYAGDGLALSLEVAFGAPLVDGVVARDATITLERGDGDLTLLPAAGLVACRR